MKLTRDREAYGSYVGVCLTILMYAMASVFLYSKAMVLNKGSDITIMRQIQEDAYTYEQTFTAEQGLYIAAALSEYDSETEIIERPEYGELVIEQYGWGYSETEIGVQSNTLEQRPCSDEELGLIEGGDSSVYPISKSSRSEVTTWKKKFKCINRSDMEIWGDYNSPKAQQLSVKFRMCKGEGCEDEEDIRKWLAGKFIILLTNEIKFNPNGFHEESKIMESNIRYIPVSSQVRQIIPYKLLQTHLVLQDYDVIELDSLTAATE